MFRQNSYLPVGHRSAHWLAATVCVALQSAEPLTVGIAAASADNNSRSYQMGYAEMTGYVSDVVTQANKEGQRETKAQAVGPRSGVASLCNDFLQGIITAQAMPHGESLPAGFSSRDYLDGCEAAGQDILNSGN